MTIQSAITSIKQSMVSPAIRKRLGLILGFILVALIAYYWYYSSRYYTTDNAYINANVVQVSSRISGNVTAVHVVNNQFVKKGDVLFKLDPQPYQVMLNKAQAQLTQSNVEAQIAASTANRILSLVKNKTLSAQNGDDANAKIESANALVQLSKANLAQAELDISFLEVTAPAAGWVSNLSLRVGDNIQAGQPLFALIDDSEFWLDANFKETEIEHIKPGSNASVVIDMYPSQTFKGVVESLSNGSGAAFSLLPPENATGNWIKITQRIPVRIRIIDRDPHYPLRIGTTSTVTIDSYSARAHN